MNKVAEFALAIHQVGWTAGDIPYLRREIMDLHFMDWAIHDHIGIILIPVGGTESSGLLTSSRS